MRRKKVDRCLSQIQSTRKALAGLDPPYVARSRIGRLCTSVASLVTSVFDTRCQDMPSQIAVSKNMPSNVLELVNCSNRIFHISRHISQPSEALDAEWRRDYKELIDELATLERLVTAVRIIP